MSDGSRQRFDFLLSIVRSCRTGHQLRRIIKARWPEWEEHAYFFDWLMSGFMDGVSTIIESGFVLDKADFVCDPINNDTMHVSLHKPSGFRFFHDFGCTGETLKTPDLAMAAMHEAMDNSLQKYAFLGNRTDEMLAGNAVTGLVYLGPITMEQADRLFQVLMERYKKSFHLINVLEIDKDAPLTREGITTLWVDDSSVKDLPTEWAGCDDSWDKAFLTTELTLPGL